MKRTLLQAAIIAVVLTLSLSAFAKARAETITLFHDAQLNSTTIAAGDYEVRYDVTGEVAQVTFLKLGKQVATASGQVKSLNARVDGTQVLLTESRTISEIDFGSTNTGVIFDPSMTASGK